MLRISDIGYDIWEDSWNGVCITSVSVNIRGYQCNNGGVYTSYDSDPWHLHIDSQVNTCSCNSWSNDAVSSEDNFAYYNGRNTNHACSAEDTSTANWWLGNEVILTYNPTNIPTLIPSNIPTNIPSNIPSIEPTNMPTRPPITVNGLSSSCADIMQSDFNGYTKYENNNNSIIELPNGEYTIYLYNDSNYNQTVYCSFDYLNGYAWTLIESGSLRSYSLHFDSLLTAGFTVDLPYNQHSPQSNMRDVFRLSKNTQLAIKDDSTHLLATCNFDLSLVCVFTKMKKKKKKKKQKNKNENNILVIIKIEYV